MSKVSGHVITYQKDIKYEGEILANKKEGFGTLYKTNSNAPQLTIYEG